MAKKIKLTDVMADVMRQSFDRYVSSAAGVGTVVALMDRGLAGDGRTGRHKLTEAGMRVHRDLVADPSRRAWTPEELTPAPEPCAPSSRVSRPVPRLSSDAVGALVNSAKTGVLHVQTSDRVRSRLSSMGLADREGRLTPEGSRTAYRLRAGSIPLPPPEDMDAGRLTLEEAQEEAQAAGLMGELSVVRIAYADGTTEECRNIPSGEIAAGIFAEAVSNDRVVKAELVRGDGTVAAQHPYEPMPRATVLPGTCGRHASRSVVRSLGLSEHPVCGRPVGHLGHHRSVPYIPGLMANQYWGDNECVPLDPQP